MLKEDDLITICKVFQESLELNSHNIPTGSCYLSAHLLTKYFKSLNVTARSVTGSIALMDKKGKYIVYGNIKFRKHINVGDYHSWCEVIIDNEIFIVDPSLKYNIYALRKTYKVKLSQKIPTILITKEFNTYNWKYIENDDLKHYSDSFVKRIPSSITKRIIGDLKKLNFSN